MPKSGPHSWYLARRMKLLVALRATGLERLVAERWVHAWEIEARARGLDQTTLEFWDQAAVWITERRRP